MKALLKNENWQKERKEFNLRVLLWGPHFLVCVRLVGFLAAGLKTLSAPKPESLKDDFLFTPGLQEEQGKQLAKPSDKRTEDPEILVDDYAAARARLQKIKGLLPAAKRLALAVSTDESAKLLTTRQGAVEDGGAAATSLVDNRTLERFLTKTEGALRRLHQASIEHAKQVIQAAKFLPALLAFGPWGEETFDSSHKVGACVNFQRAELLFKSYLSPCEHAGGLNERLEEVEKQVLSKLRFENAGDGDVLLTTAAAVGSLRATSESMTHAVTVAGDLGKDSVFGIKCTIIGNHNEIIWDIENHVSALECRAAAAVAENCRDK